MLLRRRMFTLTRQLSTPDYTSETNLHHTAQLSFRSKFMTPPRIPLQYRPQLQLHFCVSNQVQTEESV
jgi:hypothetical protein